MSLSSLADPALPLPESSSAELKERALGEWLRAHAPVLIAFSGGVDSSYLAFIAHRELGDGALSVTGLSPSFPEEQRAEARSLVETHGFRHLVVETEEMEREEYRSNPTDRCRHCKTELFSKLIPLAERRGIGVVCDGANADDIFDYRPGMAAGHELGVKSPLLAVGMTKKDIRERSRFWDLPTADKPASPCLSSRIPYGMPVTIEKLSTIERGERALRNLGFRVVRLRHHDKLARVEIGLDELPRAFDPEMSALIVAALKPLGFTFITLDLEGFRSGALNVVAGVRPSVP